MLNAIGDRARRFVKEGAPWTNVYGLARTMMALSSALTLSLNRSSILWRPIAGVATRPPFCTAHTIQKGALYCLMPAHLEAARWVAVAILLVVASGWQPRITGVLHWWVAASYQLTASTLEGGDQAAAVLTLLLIPVTLTDPRSWHWQKAPSIPEGGSSVLSAIRALVAPSALLVVRVQVCGIYFHAAFGKLQAPEWANGTAMYYWLSHPTFGATHAFSRILQVVLSKPALLAGLTWGSIIVELFLFMGLFATRPVRRVLLCLGIGLHLGIMLLMGLTSFSVTMFAALILYLRPTDELFSWPLASFRARLAGFRQPGGVKRQGTFPNYASTVTTHPIRHEPSHEAAECVRI
jgi:antimicrobial peptide system SdpB family protein